MQISIGNNIALIDIPTDMKNWFVQQLTFSNPKYEEALDRGRYVGNIDKFIYMFKTLPNGIIIPRGWLQVVERSLLNKGYGAKIQDHRVLHDPISVASNILLRPYQTAAKTANTVMPKNMDVLSFIFFRCANASSHGTPG